MGIMDIFGKGLSMFAPLANAIPGAGPLVAAGLGALGGALGNRGGTTNQTSTTHGVQSTDMLTGPEYDPKTQLLRDHLINAYMGQMEGNDDYFKGYTAQGLSNINAGADAASRQMQNALASRGIQGPMAGAGLSAPLLAAMGQKSTLLNSIPQLQDQRNQQILKDTSGFLSSLPIAQRQKGTVTNDTTTKGAITTPSNMLGGAFQGAGSVLGAYYGNKAAQQQNNPVSDVPGGISDYYIPDINWGSSQPSQTPMAPPPPMYQPQTWQQKLYNPQLPF